MAEDGQDSPEARIPRKIRGILGRQEGSIGPQEAPGGPKTDPLGDSWGLLGPLGGPLEAILQLKMAQDRRRWAQMAPKHGSLVKYE